MSHSATNWAIKQRGLKPIAKLVLWHLADCHNPTQGCFPTQGYLATEAEVSRASVNRYLEELETIGLIRREARVDEETKRQLPTRYFLAFEEGFEPLDIVPRVSGMDTESRVSEDGVAVSQNEGDPCLTAETRREPVIGTGKGNQEKNARTRLDPTDGLALVVPGTPEFRALKSFRGKRRLIPGKSGNYTVRADELAQAIEKYGLEVMH